MLLPGVLCRLPGALGREIALFIGRYSQIDLSDHEILFLWSSGEKNSAPHHFISIQGLTNGSDYKTLLMYR